MKTIGCMMLSMVLVGSALAQPAPPPPDGGDRGGPPPQRRDGGDDGPRDRGEGGPREKGPRDGMPGMRGRGADMMGAGSRDAMDPRFRQLEMLRGYLDAVGGYARLARDADTAGIAAVVTAADMLRPRGVDAGIDYFTKLLPETKSPAVGRAIRMHLIELYKSAGQQDKALEQVKILITAEPSTQSAPPSAPDSSTGSTAPPAR